MEFQILDDEGYFEYSCECDENPREKGKYITPSNAVLTTAPVANEGFLAKYVNEEWVYEADHRGKIAYLTTTGEPFEITYKGPLKDHCTFEERPSEYHTWVNNSWTMTEEATKQRFKDYKYNLVLNIKNTANSMGNTLLLEYPQVERDSFASQVDEATKYLAAGDTKPDTPLLSNLAVARKVPLDLLCKKVHEKDIAFRKLLGSIIGKRQELHDKINKCTTIEELQKIKKEVETWTV